MTGGNWIVNVDDFVGELYGPRDTLEHWRDSQKKKVEAEVRERERPTENKIRGSVAEGRREGDALRGGGNRMKY